MQRPPREGTDFGTGADFKLPDLQIEVKLSGHVSLFGKPLWDWRVRRSDGYALVVSYKVKTENKGYGVGSEDKAFKQARKAAARVCEHLLNVHEREQQVLASTKSERVTCDGL